ncbi:MAG: response regulator [Candidatus Latescibacteria bacterium]|nr:response regulator [Candidatus Latescibacterota bacterium]NIM21367.1 response regulator [Candidatus Latescibacterota bacterium]NIM65548.1 response regulator [Candidatus Latescibacterota bacterium]NIO01928.1 response regulator [Candidatus Latescibacterota bacterium]NIO28741.1 response regulator [Candidatus Latescibacterota bacterium]
MKSQKLMVVADLPDVADFLVNELKSSYHVLKMATGIEAMEVLCKERYDMLIVDIATSGADGEAFISKVVEMGMDIIAIADTAMSDVDIASKLIRLGACDCIEKPIKIDALKHAIERAIEFRELERRNRALQTQLEDTSGAKLLVGNSVAIQQIREKIRLVAPAETNIFLTGENGTGKGLVAQEIHLLSNRKSNPFIKINCASVPETLLESQLFGQEIVAPTGAIHFLPGRLELSNAGTVLLEEITEMSATTQAKLLRVLEEGEFDGIDGKKTVKVDVRIIGATNRDPMGEIRKGNLREDLYYRLNVVPIELPPLRERSEDIPLLIDHFVEIYASRNHREPIKLTPDAMKKLCKAYWKGNVRELENHIERAVIMAGGTTLDTDFFQLENERDEQLSRMEHAFRYGSIRDMEKLMILNRLVELKENRTRAAKSLDISVRTLRNKLNEYSISRKVKSLSEEQDPVSVHQ